MASRGRARRGVVRRCKAWCFVRSVLFLEGSDVAKKESKVNGIGGDINNDAAGAIATLQPYRALIRIEGAADILFHRWSCEAVEAKASAAKGSKAKKVDDVESYVYRDEDRQLCIPGEYLRQSLINAAKYKQDPRSPRKSAMDLMKAALVPLTVLAPLGTADWDYLHKCRVQVQRNAVTRVRPAMKAGWSAEFIVLVNLPEYVEPTALNELTQSAGRLIGLGDFRPTYGRYVVTSFEVLND